MIFLAPAVTVGETEGAMDSTSILFLAPADTVGETKGAMDSASVFFLPFLLPITL